MKTYNDILATLLRESAISGCPVQLKVISQSMSPTLETGDIIKVEKKEYNHYRRGDLLVHIGAGKKISTHRLIAKKQSGWVVKGDSNLVPDPPVQLESILGHVVEIQRHDQCIKLETRYWDFINRFFGLLGFLEILALNCLPENEKLKKTDQHLLPKKIITRIFQLTTKAFTAVLVPK